MTIIPETQATDTEKAAAEHADQVATDIERYAAFLRTNPDVAAEITSPEHFLIYLMPGDSAKQQMADIIRAAKSAGAAITKDANDKFAGANMHFGQVTVKVYSEREVVCERRVTGTREIEVEEQDPEALANVPTRKVTKTVDEVEWVCTPILDATSPAEAETVGADA